VAGSAWNGEGDGGSLALMLREGKRGENSQGVWSSCQKGRSKGGSSWGGGGRPMCGAVEEGAPVTGNGRAWRRRALVEEQGTTWWGGGSACGWRGPGAMGLARKEKYPFAIHSNKIQWI
jgi:hypothetical protein